MRHNSRVFLFLIAPLTFPLTGRCQSFGTVDETYATNGVATFNDHGEEFTLDLVLRPNGNEFMLCAQFINDLSVATIRSITGAGGPDNSFSGDGWLSTAFTNENVVFMDGKVDANGRLVVFGGAGTEEPDIDLVVQRYQTGGSVDATFGGPQGVRLPYSGGAYGVEGVILPDGKMIVVASAGGSNILLTKLSSTGQVETSFGINGYRFITPPTGMELEPQHLVLLPSGKFLVGASLTPVDAGTAPACFMRFTSQGALDQSFGPDGMVVIDLAPGVQPWLNETLIADMHALPNGDVSVILSAADANEMQQLIVMQIPADDEGGCMGLDLLTEQGYQAECAAVLAGGNSLVCSSLYNSECRVAHVQSDCAVDQGLGGTGYIPMTPVASIDAYPEVMVRRNDGRVDVLMSVFSFEEPSYSVIVRLHADDVASVDEAPSNNTLRIEPQPVTDDAFHIRSSAALDNRLQLVGMDGRLVADLRARANSDARHQVDLPTTIVNGAYILRGTVDGHSFAHVLVVQR